MSSIAWCPAARLDELQAFIDEHWKRGHILARDAELLRWQHPRTEDELSFLVVDDASGAIAGILGIIPADCCFAGERRPGHWLTTWVVREDLRTQHIGLALLRALLDETGGLVATLGGNDTTMRMLGALRFHTVPSVPRWVRPVSAPALDALLTAAGAGRWTGDVDPAPAGGGGLDVGGFDAPAWDAAWAADFAPGLVGTWRDAAYVQWRYRDHPRFDYRVRLATEGGRARGLAVWRRQVVEGRAEEVLRIVELLGDEAAGRALVAEILAEAAESAVAFADFYCTSPAFAAPLESAGFAREDPGGPVLPALFQPLDARRTALTGAFWASDGTERFAGRDVYFTRSDGDQDRPN